MPSKGQIKDKTAFGQKKNQQTSYLRGLLIKKLVTRTGIESSSCYFLSSCNISKMAILRDFSTFGMF